MTCSRFDVVVVPFPFSERPAQKRRPALALSRPEFNAASGATLLAMITSAANPPWPLDVGLHLSGTGLRAPSKVRMKLFTLDNRLIAERIGTLHVSDQTRIAMALRRMLGRF
ncbi:MAG: type II toxin-antitoxin system PemK/MazF family toxin [Terriglobales bacterium]